MKFGFLEFDVTDGKACLTGHFGYKTEPQGFVEAQLAGENTPTHLNGKTVRSSESKKLGYLYHEESGDTLTIVQRSDKIEVKTIFKSFSQGNSIAVYNEITNISEEDIVLESAPSFVLKSLFNKSHAESNEIYLTEFLQGHHFECQPKRNNFYDLGFCKENHENQIKEFFASVGSQSTKERLPQVVLEDAVNGKTMICRVDSGCSWFYEISDYDGRFYLSSGSANLNYLNWAKKLKRNETYKTSVAAIACGKDLNSAMKAMTDYLRTLKPFCKPDENLPVIFNEYMHLSWDSPSENNTRKYAEFAKNAGADYYVIDCGWHDEVDGKIIYPYVGEWKESNARFPGGVRATTDYIRSLGLKAGLWIEPEIVGVKCEKMIKYYGDECFITRFGKKIAVGDRYFLDYRNKKVRDNMTETIRRMVEDYGADYIKFDYNQDLGVGTDKNAFVFGEGLEECSKAFREWVEEITARFNGVIFECCASGGMRLDYCYLSKFSLVSTSDQTDYKIYPYISANIASAVLPEQAAVWSYPVDRENVEKEQVVMNMINSFSGRMHLASDLSKLSDENFSLVKEGVKYYKKLSAIKSRAYPFMPLGFSKLFDKTVAGGLMNKGKIYLAVWNLKGDKTVKIPVKSGVKNVELAYPANDKDVTFSLENQTLTVNFTKDVQARFFELT